MEELLCEIKHEQQLVRTKGQTKLKSLLDSKTFEETKDELKQGVLGLLKSDSISSLLGGFLAASSMVQYYKDDAAFLEEITQICIRNLENPEGRVRNSVGDCLGSLAKVRGNLLYDDVKESIVQSIFKNFDREEEKFDDPDDPLESLLEVSYRLAKPGTGELRHGTEGWKSLETSYRALLKIAESTGDDFAEFVDSDLWKLVFRGVTHMNRFVREISFFTIGAIIKIGDGDAGEITKVLAKGLGDDWSQVRYSSSVATRTFLLKIEDGEELYPSILPQMCLNRYYVADGVRLYSQESWKLVVGDRGRTLVAKHAPAFVDYYVKQCAANNHAVREAACNCIAELMTKIDKSAIESFVPRLLQSLVNGFKDASWPVRDSACLACGKCVIAFPEESRAVLDELYQLWIAHLADNIPSVRENSAVALADAISAYGQEALDRVLPEIRSMICRAKDQEADSISFSGLKNVSQFGVAPDRDTEDAAHTDQTMFSCGSLAPKLARGGGCMDHGFKRPKQPWEESDGSVYFLRELSRVATGEVEQFMPFVVDLLRLDHFTHVHSLHETIWRVMPVIARNIGKRQFKKYLNEMLDPLFRSIKCDNQLEETAAADAAFAFSRLLGEGIFKGRLNENQLSVFEGLSRP